CAERSAPVRRSRQTFSRGWRRAGQKAEDFLSRSPSARGVTQRPNALTYWPCGPGEVRGPCRSCGVAAAPLAAPTNRACWGRTAMSPMISIAAVTKRYKSGLVALDAVDLDIARGEIFA